MIDVVPLTSYFLKKKKKKNANCQFKKYKYNIRNFLIHYFINYFINDFK